MRNLIWVAADEEEMTEVWRKRDYYRKRDVPTEVLDASALQVLEPNLRKGMMGGLLVPEDGVLYPPCAARFLIERAQGSGAKLQKWDLTLSGSGEGSVQFHRRYEDVSPSSL